MSLLTTHETGFLEKLYFTSSLNNILEIFPIFFTYI